MSQEPPAKRKARHIEIQAKLRAGIADGTYPLGSLLPPEQVLCKELGASRFTVRQALAGLRSAGLIESRSGFGTVVTRTRVPETITHRMTTFEELLRYPGKTIRRQLEIETITAGSDLARLLKIPTGSQWVYLKSMRLARDTNAAISWVNAYIAPRFADVLDLPNPDGAPLLTQIEKQHDHRAAGADVEIFVGRIDPDLAEPLQCQANDPALIIVRRYQGSDGEVYLVTHSIHPENRFSLAFEMSRQVDTGTTT